MKMNKWRLLSYIGILGLICVCSFLIAKYIIRDSIYGQEIPIDTSVRLN